MCGTRAPPDPLQQLLLSGLTASKRSHVQSQTLSVMSYTIVTSLARDRPSNATARCGVAFIPWPKDGDGAGHPDDGFLIVRNMLLSPSFHHAVQNTTTPGDEKAVLGAYYPRGTYTTKAAFQKPGC